MPFSEREKLRRRWDIYIVFNKNWVSNQVFAREHRVAPFRVTSGDRFIRASAPVSRPLDMPTQQSA